ncbi:hypothetical protein A4X09_0g7668 [Tilletia walkeri]|uniref:Retrotransposon gag domain-containing protein n=1 Tax=Tilletia walkeri TaxID=117179 RepID=A0A8X7N1H6_9BASI|nr:hypothetical protein A4X09_0g7668 [Tilletia walkeri]
MKETIQGMGTKQTSFGTQVEDVTDRLRRLELSRSRAPSPVPEAVSTVKVEPSSSEPAESESKPVSRTEASSSSSGPTKPASRPEGSSSSTGPVVNTPPSSNSALYSVLTNEHKGQLRLLLKDYRYSMNKLFGSTAEDTETPTPTFSSNTLTCKKDILGEFDGDPSKLEQFISHVRNIVRSDQRSGWETAVVRALPQALKGDADIWNSGLSDDEARDLNSLDKWVRALRSAFPMKKNDQRQQARERVWQPTQETALTYYIAKVQLLRHAYGTIYTDAAIAQEVLAGLPATMRVIFRLPQEGTTLQAVQSGLSEWEPSWREAHQLRRAKISASVPSLTPVGRQEPATSKATQQPARPPRSELRNSPASPSTTSRPRDRKLSEDFDPTRLGRGQRPGSQKENVLFYRIPDTTDTMWCDRPCRSCGQDHFDFAHDHFAAQVRFVTTHEDDQYPVTSAEDGNVLGDSPQHF